VHPRPEPVQMQVIAEIAIADLDHAPPGLVEERR
jgi:hypothetical protein